MYLIIGLGNYDKNYVDTRHNAGFFVVNQLKELWKATDFKLKSKLKAELSVAKRNNQTIILVKPKTYINLSGKVAKKIVDYYRIPLNKIIIIYDDLDIEIGSYKITTHPYQGGHKGTQSVSNYLNSNQFIRVKIGIEKQGGREKRGKVSGKDFVLQKFSIEEKKMLQQMVSRLVQDLEEYLKKAN